MNAQPAPTPVTARALLHAIGAAADVVGPGQGWDGEPVPLQAQRVRPPFPVQALPSWLGEHVAAVTEATQTPADLAGALALACLSTAAGGRVVVSPSRSWTEPTNLYTVVALPPGSRKSAVFRMMTAPLVEAETVLRESMAGHRIDAELAARAAQANADRLARAVESGTAPPETRAEAIAAAEDAARIVVPALPRLTTDDVTPESCTSLLAAHGGRIAVLSAEGDAFATLTGTRYSTSANLGVFLKGHAGDRLQVDRKSRESETIDHPALTLGITTQPGSLAGLADQPGFRDRGVLARLLYALPHNTVGTRRIDPDPVPLAVQDTYTTQLRTLVLDLADADPAHHLTLTGDARQLLMDFTAWLEPHLNPDGGTFAPIGDWAAKLAGAIVRIAALLHLAHHGATAVTRPIDADTYTHAELIGRYYLAHAVAVFDLMGHADPTTDDARHVLTWITRTHTTIFTRRDLFNAVRGTRFTKVTDLTAALDLLTDHGYIREQPRDTTRPGRPSLTYDVHPATHHPAQNPQNTQNPSPR